VETPYFKTWKDIVATVTVFNLGTCFWEAGSHYIAPMSYPIPEVLPGGFVVLQVPIDAQPGLTVITPVVMGEFGESLTPQMQMDAMGQPSALEQFDYAEPASSVPAGVIVINWPTQDWEGLQYPQWKMVKPGWWIEVGGDGTGYHFGDCPPGG
jgi:hypothetical protein